MTTQDFLVELGTEELPPKALQKLSAAFGSGIEAGLKASSLSFDEVELFATPRRLSVLVRALVQTQPNTFIEKVGPAVKAAFDGEGAPTKAAEGFARSCGVEVADLSEIEKDGVTKLYYRSEKEGEKTSSLLPEIVKTSLAKLPIPKRMRWGASRDEFVRPVHWGLMLFGSEVIDCKLLGVSTSNTTRGHRFHCNTEIEVHTPSDYEVILQDQGHVIADFTKRKEKIRQQVLEKAAGAQATAVIDEDLLNEVTALVELPVALLGQFDEEFLQVPAEALILAMKSHQKYFCLVDDKKNLKPAFISVSNILSKDPDQVVAGNERVIRPRLADARFFYETDLKTSLDENRQLLKSIVFQEKLGTVYEKSHRVELLAEFIAKELGVNPRDSKRASQLAKCDLVSNMVGEFADLQGLMGSYYAAESGENSEVSAAIEEQYRPRYSGDSLPKTSTGQILSLSEKFDTMCGLFAIGQPPTGSKDPFAIRRAALGILRILVESKINLDVHKVVSFSLSLYNTLEIEQDTANQVVEFLFERFRSWYQDEGIKAEVFQSVLAVRPTNPLDFDSRVQAVKDFTALPEAQNLASANKRVANLIAKNPIDSNLGLDESLLEEDAEKALYKLLVRKESDLAPLVVDKNYNAYLQDLATMSQVIDQFFADVLVICDDDTLRLNRLLLLSHLQKLFLKVADISFLHSGK